MDPCAVASGIGPEVPEPCGRGCAVTGPPPPCLYSTGRHPHPAEPPVRVATVHAPDGTSTPVYACAEHAPALTVTRGGEPR